MSVWRMVPPGSIDASRPIIDEPHPGRGPESVGNPEGTGPRLGGLSLVFGLGLRRRLPEPEDRAEGGEDAEGQEEADEVEHPAHG